MRISSVFSWIIFGIDTIPHELLLVYQYQQFIIQSL